LSITDPTHNVGIRLATGSFRTSRPESLFAEAGEPPLSSRRNLLLCNYAAKLSSQPSHPSYTAVFKHIIRHRYGTNSRASRPVGVRLQQLLMLLNVNLPRIVPCRFTPTPPWLLTLPPPPLTFTLKRTLLRVHSTTVTSRRCSPITPATQVYILTISWFRTPLYTTAMSLNSDFTAWLVYTQLRCTQYTEIFGLVAYHKDNS
jgi:hypothetical protein